MSSIDKIFGLEPLDKNSTLIVVGGDTLAISVAGHRISNGGFVINDSIVPQPQDVEVAEKIADHFRKQIMVTELRTGRLSPFQAAVRAYLDSDRTSYRLSQTGLIYRLPQFYYRDIEFNKMVDQHYWGSPDKSTIVGLIKSGKLSSKLVVKPISKHPHSQSNGWGYWFKEVDTGAAVSLRIPSNNTLLWMWEHYFLSGNTMTLFSEHVSVKQHPADVAYVSLYNWRMEFPE